MQHLLIVLHPTWRTPGAGKQDQFPAGRSNRIFNQRNFILAIRRHVKTLKRFVPLFYIGVHLARKIATVDIGPSQGISNAFNRIKIAIQNFLLFFLRQLCICFGGGIRERATNPDKGLEGFTRIHKNARLCFQRLTKWR